MLANTGTQLALTEAPYRRNTTSSIGFKSFSAKTVALKVKYPDFAQATRSRTNALPVLNGNEILESAS